MCFVPAWRKGSIDMYILGSTMVAFHLPWVVLHVYNLNKAPPPPPNLIIENNYSTQPATLHHVSKCIPNDHRTRKYIGIFTNCSKPITCICVVYVKGSVSRRETATLLQRPLAANVRVKINDRVQILTFLLIWRGGVHL